MTSFIKLSLRLNLSEFIDTKYENIILSKISTMSENIKNQILIYLWYTDISVDDITNFIERWESGMKYRTIIKSTNIHPPQSFVWFDITDSENKENCSNYRFKYIYEKGNINDILRGIDEFYSVVTFCQSPKPAKKQKRND